MPGNPNEASENPYRSPHSPKAESDYDGSVIKRCAFRGAVTGAIGGFAIQASLTFIVNLTTSGLPGLFELAFQFVFIGVVAAIGATFGLIAGVIVGVAFKAIERLLR